MKSLQSMQQQIESMAAQVEQLRNPYHLLKVNVSWIPRTQLLLLPSAPDNKQLTLEEAQVLRKLVFWMAEQLRCRPRKLAKTVIHYTISAPAAVKLGADFSTGSVLDQAGKIVCSLDEFMANYIESGIWWKSSPGALAEYLGGYADERAVQVTGAELETVSADLAPADSEQSTGPDLDLPW